MRMISYFFAASLLFFLESSMASDVSLCIELNYQSYQPCKRLASAGDPDGQFGLGMLFLEGVGVEQDYVKSFELMYKAAIQGHSAAQFQVGQAYVNGQGVKKNYDEAYSWFLVSRENGNPIAEKGISFMNSNQLIDRSRINAITQRANDIYAKTKNKKGFQYNETKSVQSVSGLVEYCDMVMPSVDGVINYKKYGKPISDAQQLMIGMTDKRSIRMMNGVIEWVWSSNVFIGEMSAYFKRKCLEKSSEVDFIFP